MAASDTPSPKGAGTASGDGSGGSTGFFLSLPDTLQAELDRWIAVQPDPKPTRHEAVHQLVRQALGR
jgi:hypothetical protein